MRDFYSIRDDFIRALSAKNWNDVVVHATDLLLQKEDLSWVWGNRGIALHGMGFHLDAILNFDKALSIDSDSINSASVYNNKGAAYFDLEKIKEALECYEKAKTIDPTMAQTYMNIGHAHKWVGNDEDAIESYRKAIEIDPNYADGQMALGMMLLKNGQLREGWERFEYRWKTAQLPPRGLKLPQWKGEDLTEKTLLIYAEQGLGDIIQFGRYVRIVNEYFPSCKIIVEGRQPVKRLLETLPEIYKAINFGEKVPEADYAIPMITLGGMLTPNIIDIPVMTPEYFIDQADVSAWATRLEPLFERCPGHVKVGICWAGMARAAQPMAAKVDSLRSTSFATFAPLAKIPNIVWLSLQKGPPATQVQKPPTGMTIGDFSEDMYDFYETCAAIANLDLVITVDTAVVHAAASLGKPTWLLSRWDGCWRWMGTREDSPWYPTLRQFVQPAPHDWDGMMAKVAEELKKFVEARN